jgi:transcriptional regulator with XRE-family HTH domain
MRLRDFLKRQLEDEQFAQLWRRFDPSFQAGALLVNLRSQLGLSQAELAERAGVKRPYIARIEAGKANPTVESLGKVLAAVGYSLRLSALRQEEADGDPSGGSVIFQDLSHA